MKKLIIFFMVCVPAGVLAQTLNNIPARSAENTVDGALSGSLKAITSQRIPDFPVKGTLIENLANTVWMAVDIKRGEEFYLFFQNGTHSVSLTKRGGIPKYPDKLYPIKGIVDNPEDNSSIVIVASQNRLLYYSFKLLSPYYLGISAGFDTPEPLQELTISDYFNNGYIMHLVY